MPTPTDLLAQLRHEIDSTEMNAALHMLGRAGALHNGFHIGWAPDAPVSPSSRWFVTVQLPASPTPITVKGKSGPLAAVEGMVRRLLNGGQCQHCGATVSVVATGSGDRPRGGTLCLYRMIDGQWQRGCVNTHPGPQQPSVASMSEVLAPLRHDLFGTTASTPVTEAQSAWVRSGVDVDGVYRLTIEYCPDVAVTLDEDRALAYARQVMIAAAHAEHDAAVARQLMKALDMDADAVSHTIAALRADRPELDQQVLGVLTLKPGVSASGEGFLLCGLVDNPLDWQWTPATARSHASHVLEVGPTPHLDAAYRRHLVSTVGLDDDTARMAVAGLANYYIRD